jgi:alpha-beta hydrolase superfamily lysophospholipase
MFRTIFSGQSSSRFSMRRTLRLIAKGLALFLLLLLTLSLWNFAMASWERERNPVPGKFHTVNGLQMHIDCSGTGSPVVVMEAAASATWWLWRNVQSDLARITEVCSYDRAGHGWSEPRKGPRDAETIVRELHLLLEQAGIKRPFVLAGHSAGGLYVREYVREFPGEIA